MTRNPYPKELQLAKEPTLAIMLQDLGKAPPLQKPYKPLKFSHSTYSKFTFKEQVLNFEDRVKLIQIFIEDKANLHHEFICYDTMYSMLPQKAKKKEYYQLPPGLNIILLFLTEKGNLLTTVRRWTENKEKYYRKQIGKTFEIIKV